MKMKRHVRKEGNELGIMREGMEGKVRLGVKVSTAQWKTCMMTILRELVDE